MLAPSARLKSTLTPRSTFSGDVLRFLVGVLLYNVYLTAARSGSLHSGHRYQQDMAAAARDSTGRLAELYSSFNLLVRRKPKENNFKAVLETIRDLMNVDAVGAAMPGWLRDVFLGYGDAAAANYRSLQIPGQAVEVRASPIKQCTQMGSRFLLWAGVNLHV